MTINTDLIITICIFVAVMYGLYRLFNYLDYEQRHREINMNIKNLKEWDRQ